MIDFNQALSEFKLGEHIAVLGYGGKSTLARAIAQQRGHTYIELDAILWLPNWVKRERGEFVKKVEESLIAAGESWIVDGNCLTALADKVLVKSDTVIFINMPWRIMFWRILKRSFMRAVDRRKICGENRENLKLTFMSRNSLLLWHIQQRHDYAKRGELIRRLKPSAIPMLEISTPQELDQFYLRHNLQTDFAP